MADERKFADVASLRPVVRAAFGRSRSLQGIERLPGGSKKGAYRLTMDDGGTALAYIWDDSEDYWQGVLPESAHNPADPFTHASGRRCTRWPSRSSRVRRPRSSTVNSAPTTSCSTATATPC